RRDENDTAVAAVGAESIAGDGLKNDVGDTVSFTPSDVGGCGLGLEDLRERSSAVMERPEGSSWDARPSSPDMFVPGLCTVLGAEDDFLPALCAPDGSSGDNAEGPEGSRNRSESPGRQCRVHSLRGLEHSYSPNPEQIREWHRARVLGGCGDFLGHDK
ncbi:hypothetical protein FB45DRAFT_923448, partial [Roridomyces roridus]